MRGFKNTRQFKRTKQVEVFILNVNSENHCNL